MRIGAHESVAGGLFQAPARGEIDSCEAIQIFTKNSSTWREPVLEAAAIEAFRAAKKVPVLSHMSYLINLATDKPDVLEKSKAAVVAELERSSALGIDYAVLHPGAHLGLGADKGVLRVAEMLGEILERVPNATTKLLIENTAGQGTCVGCRFEEVGAILKETRGGDRMGVCLDTQHLFASGYDIATDDGYAHTFETFEREVGLANIQAFHLNDSKKPLGSRVDRHEHIGEGLLGLRLFWRLVNDARFKEIPGLLETEPRKDGPPYRAEIDLLRGFVGAEAPPPPKRDELPPPIETFSLAMSEPTKSKRKK